MNWKITTSFTQSINLTIKRGVFSRAYSTINDLQSLPNYYQVLGVNSDSSSKDIKAKYYKLSMKYHPDRSTDKDSTEIFSKINEAYSIIGDETKKREYDERMVLIRKQTSSSNPYGSSNFHGHKNPFNFDKTRQVKYDVNAHFYAHYGQTLKKRRVERDEYDAQSSSVSSNFLITLPLVIILIGATLKF